jgi:DNA-binding transcriptional ArsR family regulator
MVVGNATELDIDQVFRALADATRRDILTRAVARGQSVSTLARRYDMSFAAVQKHVAVLERAQLITKQKQGREQIVYGETAVLRHVTELLETYEQLWIQRTHQIADLLAGEEGSPE